MKKIKYGSKSPIKQAETALRKKAIAVSRNSKKAMMMYVGQSLIPSMLITFPISPIWLRLIRLPPRTK